MGARVGSLALIGMLTALAGTTPVSGQVDRAALIERARLSPEEGERRDLYIAAANPVQRDSLWAVSVYEIAQIMRDVGQDDVAATWIRFAVRHGAWAMDDAYFAPSLVTFYSGQVASVSADAEPNAGAVSTAWHWPDGFSQTAPGSLEVSTNDPDAEISVAVAGQDLEPGAPLEIPPGTYDLVASAVGYESMHVQREVLPGAETIVTFDLVPLLGEGVAQRVAASVVRLRSGTGAAAVCRNGVTARDDFVVTSLRALAGEREVEVLPDGRPALAGVVVETDPAEDLAVLNVQGLSEQVRDGGGVPGPTFGWFVYRTGCNEEFDVLRTRVSAAGQAESTIPPTAVGSPLVDRTGSLMGMVSDGGRIVPAGRIGEVVTEAAAQFDHGGFPVVWAALGAAIVGGAAALFFAGGDEPAPPGSIVIQLP